MYSETTKIDVLAPKKIIFNTSCSAINIVCKAGSLIGEYGIMKTINEPVLEYAPNSNERINIQKEYDRMASTITEIPLIIDGKEIFTHEISECIQPHDHQKVLAKYHKAQEKEVNIAISSSLKS